MSTPEGAEPMKAPLDLAARRTHQEGTEVKP